MRTLVLTTFAMLVFSAAAANAQLKTVTDYFLALPSNVYATNITGDKYRTRAELIKFRRSMIKVEDTKNGYLRVEGPWEGWGEIALFKLSAGGYLVADSNVGCGPGCTGSLSFYKYANGKWSDVTKAYAPKISDKALFAAYKAKGGNDPDITSGEDFSYYFVLPREGRTMRVGCNMCTDSEDFTFIDYEWNGAAFVKK